MGSPSRVGLCLWKLESKSIKVFLTQGLVQTRGKGVIKSLLNDIMTFESLSLYKRETEPFAS